MVDWNDNGERQDYVEIELDGCWELENTTVISQTDV